jgi:hypothetical protein
VRSWTIIVSAGLHVLAAVALAHVPAPGVASVTSARTEDTIVPLEVAMVEPPAPPMPLTPTPTATPPTEPAPDRGRPRPPCS